VYDSMKSARRATVEVIKDSSVLPPLSVRVRSCWGDVRHRYNRRVPKISNR